MENTAVTGPRPKSKLRADFSSLIKYNVLKKTRKVIRMFAAFGAGSIGLRGRYTLLPQLTSCQGTDSCPGSHGSKTKILTNGKLHVEQRDSVDCKHHKIWYQERCC